jgi:hypothetical protein
MNNNEPHKHINVVSPRRGDRIRFLKTLKRHPNEDGPGICYATAGAFGTIDNVGGCWEGCWVFWDGRPSDSFGARLGVDFELVLGDEGLEHKRRTIYT